MQIYTRRQVGVFDTEGWKRTTKLILFLLGPEDLLPPILQKIPPGDVPPDYTCSAETQTYMTGFEIVLDSPSGITAPGDVANIETQTGDIIDLLK